MDNPNSNPLKLDPHHMLAIFMALVTYGGEKSNFSTICFQAFEIFPHIFDPRNEMWFLTKAKFTLGPHFMCLKGLHIV
jgi:hypothetical protein